MCNFLKSELANGYWSEDEGEITWTMFLLESALHCPYVYCVSTSLGDSQASSLCSDFLLQFSITFRLLMRYDQ